VYLKLLRVTQLKVLTHLLRLFRVLDALDYRDCGRLDTPCISFH
jgi:hypothetical protein